MHRWAVALMLLAAVATAAWAPGGRAHAEADQLRIDLIGMIDTANTLPADNRLVSFALVNDTPYTWIYPTRAGEPDFERRVRALIGWGLLPAGASADPARRKTPLPRLRQPSPRRAAGAGRVSAPFGAAPGDRDLVGDRNLTR